MRSTFELREMAEEQRCKAGETPLLMVRLKHLAAADKWELMARKAERADRKSPANRHPALLH